MTETHPFRQRFTGGRERVRGSRIWLAVVRAFQHSRLWVRLYVRRKDWVVWFIFSLIGCHAWASAWWAEYSRAIDSGGCPAGNYGWSFLGCLFISVVPIYVICYWARTRDPMEFGR